MADTTSLDAIASLIKLFSGEKTTQSGGTTTKTESSSMSQEGLASLLKTLLESNAGLASVTQGQKTAGLYNSSTNKLLTNDLLARMTAQSLANSKSTTSTQTTSPVTVQKGGLSGNSQDMLSKLMLGLTAYNKMGGKKVTGDISSMLGIGSSVPMTDMVSANLSNDPIGSLIASQGWSDSGNNVQSIADSIPQDVWSQFDQAAMNYVANDYGMSADNTPSAGEFTVPTEAEMNANQPAPEDTTNFPVTPSGNGSQAANPSASQVLEGANSANTTINVGSTAGSVYSLYNGLTQLTDSNSKNDAYGAVNTASGAQGVYKAYDSYQNAAKMAEVANQTNAAEGVTSAYTATDYMNFSGPSAGSGSVLGYIGPVMDAFYAQNNPKGAQNPDYRHAVGGAILNYFGMGWASPIVHAVAQPVLNASMDAGTESMGTFGAVLADPVGAPLSGQYEIGDLVSSTLDPANMFGGNPGGSTGSLVAATVDPIGAALGDTGLFSVVKDTVDSTLSLDPVSSALGIGGGGGGKVICTELAMQDRLSSDLYKKAISPELIMKGQLLRGYHLIGVPLVRLIRKSPFWAEKITPYVADYIRHKAGQKNLRGLIVKSILHPISWILGFVNNDPSYYKVLYRRKRYGS